MAVTLFASLATVGVLFSLFAGLLLLAIPKTRQVGPYALLIYPSAYFGGLLPFFIVAMLEVFIEGLPAIDSGPAWRSDALEMIMTAVAFGAAALGALVGGFLGVVMANRVWWRIFASTEDRAAYPEPRGLMAMPPFLQMNWTRFLNFLRAARST